MSMNVNGLDYLNKLAKTNEADKSEKKEDTSAVDFSQEEGEEVVITEEEMAQIEAEQAAKVEEAEKAAAAQAAQATDAATATTATTAAASSAEVDGIKAEIAKLNEDRAANEAKMEKLEAKMEELAKDAEEKIVKAAAIQEEKVKDHEEECKSAVSAELAKYIEANKNEPGSMTKDQLSQNIKDALPGMPEVADALALVTEANSEVHEISSLLGDLRNLIDKNKCIDSQIDALNKNLEAAEEAG